MLMSFYSTMSTEQRVNNICRAGYAQLRNIGHIRRRLTHDATKSLIHRLVTPRLGYCNALLGGIPKTVIIKIQRVQNTAAIGS